MMKSAFQLILLCCPLFLLGQELEFISSVNNNTYFEYTNAYESEFTPANGVGFFFGIEDVDVSGGNYRFTIGFETYRGSIQRTELNSGNGREVNINAKKSVLALGIYPFNFDFFDLININLGFEGSYKLFDEINGNEYAWDNFDPGVSQDVNLANYSISNPLNVGLKGRFAIDLKVGDYIIISPQYEFYFGLTQEFRFNLSSNIYSRRHMIGFGIQGLNDRD